MKLTKLITSLKQSPIVKKGNYYYVIHPITDGVPQITPELLKEVTQAMKQEISKLTPFDKLVTIEAMGIPLASTLSLEMDIPFSIIRKRSYDLPNERMVAQQTGYSKSTLFINGLNENDSIVIVDDVLSTGGTIKAVLQTLKEMKVIVKGVFIAVDKGNIAKSLSEETQVPIHSLVHICVSNGNVTLDEEK